MAVVWDAWMTTSSCVLLAIQSDDALCEIVSAMKRWWTRPGSNRRPNRCENRRLNWME
jgi:hypothetical protein